MGRAQSPAPAPTAAGDQHGVTVLSDTMGIDFGPYLSQVKSDVQSNWQRLMPPEVQKPTLAKGTVGIRFTILPDGRIGSMKLETRSGIVSLDKAAWYAITSQGRFPPLPAEFHGPLLDLRFGFFYNIANAVPAASGATPAAR